MISKTRSAHVGYPTPSIPYLETFNFPRPLGLILRLWPDCLPMRLVSPFNLYHGRLVSDTDTRTLFARLNCFSRLGVLGLLCTNISCTHSGFSGNLRPYKSDGTVRPLWDIERRENMRMISEWQYLGMIMEYSIPACYTIGWGCPNPALFSF